MLSGYKNLKQTVLKEKKIILLIYKVDIVLLNFIFILILMIREDMKYLNNMFKKTTYVMNKSRARVVYTQYCIFTKRRGVHEIIKQYF